MVFDMAFNQLDNDSRIAVDGSPTPVYICFVCYPEKRCRARIEQFGYCNFVVNKENRDDIIVLNRTVVYFFSCSKNGQHTILFSLYRGRKLIISKRIHFYSELQNSN